MFFEIFGVGRFFLHIPSLADSPTRSLNVVQNGSKIRTFLVPATEGHTAPETQRQSVIVTGSSNGTMMHSRINRWLLL